MHLILLQFDQQFLHEPLGVCKQVLQYKTCKNQKDRLSVASETALIGIKAV